MKLSIIILQHKIKETAVNGKMDEFAKCELVIKLTGNDTVSIPINFGSMPDEDIRKLYPHMLSISKPYDNPMVKLADIKESDEWKNYTDDERVSLEKWHHDMAKYWYGKPSTSLLDIAIGIAIDIKFNGLKVIGISDGNNDIDNRYEGSLKNPVNNKKTQTRNSDSDIAEKYISKYEAGSVSRESSVSNGTMGLPMIDIYSDDDRFDKMFENIDHQHLLQSTAQSISEGVNDIRRDIETQSKMDRDSARANVDSELIEYDKNGIMIDRRNDTDSKSIELYPEDDDFGSDIIDDGGEYGELISSQEKPAEKDNNSTPDINNTTNNTTFNLLNSDDCDE